jgi:hypothetical protein
MRKVSLFGIAITMMLAGIAAWASSSHSAVKAAIGAPQVDPFSLMANAFPPRLRLRGLGGWTARDTK